MSDVTQILSAIEQGDSAAADELLPLVYRELRQLAESKLANERPGQTLQATALVHEAYLRLVGARATTNWNSQGHFFGAAAEAMRRILIENARRRQRQKHGGGRRPASLEGLEVADDSDPRRLLELDAALAQLESDMPQVAEVVKLRYFSGLTVDQTARALDISTRTTQRHWAYAKAWLFQQLGQ